MSTMVEIKMPNGAEIKEPQEVLASEATVKYAQEAATSISRAFNWTNTKEGRDFWKSVVARLEQIADNRVIDIK